MLYTVDIDTVDLDATEQHAGSLNITYIEIPGEQWPVLMLIGSKDQLQRFLCVHCGSEAAGQEYFTEHAKEFAT